MTKRRTYTRHGLSKALRRLQLEGIGSMDARYAPVRAVKAFERELAMALGGEANLSPQKRRIITLAARASLIVDVIDAWVLQQPSLVNLRNRSLLPVVIQRQYAAEHLAKLLDRLGLDRVPTPGPTLDDWVASLPAKRKNASPPVTGTGPSSHEEPDGQAPVQAPTEEG